MTEPRGRREVIRLDGRPVGQFGSEGGLGDAAEGPVFDEL